MVKVCCWGNCKSFYRDKKTTPEHVKFIGLGTGFPKPNKEREKCLRWVANCGRKNFTIDDVKKDTYICSLHFVGKNGPTESNPDPDKCDKQVERKRRGQRVSHNNPKQHRFETPTASEISYNENAPAQNASYSTGLAVFMCMQHEGEVFAFFCKSHDELICHRCVEESHSTCEKVDIGKPSESSSDNKEYTELLKQITSLNDTVSNAIIKPDKSMSQVKLFNENVSLVLKELETNVQRSNTHSLDKAKLEAFTSICRTLQTKVGKLVTEFEELLHSANSVQTVTRRKKSPRSEEKKIRQRNGEAEENNQITTRRVTEIQRKGDMHDKPIDIAPTENIYNTDDGSSLDQTITTRSMVTDIQRKAIVHDKPIDNARTENVYNRDDGASLNRSNTAVAHVKDINIKSPYARSRCRISGSAVMPDKRLVVIDHGFSRKNVKLVDTKQKKVIHELVVQGHLGRPWDVTVISANQVAVTVPWETKILILNVTNVITVSKEIHVDGKCYGIAYSQNQLIVSFSMPPRLELISLDGHVIRRIEKDSDGNRLLQYPYYVCVSNDGETIYLSDFNAHKVISLTREGVAKASYTDIKSPHKVCVDHRGNVFVCETYERAVHMLTADCKKIKIILTEEDGLDDWVYSVSHCRHTDRLYIGMRCDNIKVYQLS